MGQLVLSRELNERVFIGEDTVLTVTKIDRGRVSLAFEAPLTVRIDRDEVVPADDERRKVVGK